MAATVAKTQSVSILDAWEWTYRDMFLLASEISINKRQKTVSASDVDELIWHLTEKGIVNYGNYRRGTSPKT